MERRLTRGSERRCAAKRLVLLLAALPALVLGPALGGMAAWFHAHGSSGVHLHLLPEHDEHELAELEEWHEAEHRHEHEDRAHDSGEEEETPAPEGLLIELPRVLAATPRGTASPATVIPTALLSGLLLPPRWHLAPVEGVHRPELCRSGWPPQRTKRSAVAELLRSSHALLI